jgi:hypothetical protein
MPEAPWMTSMPGMPSLRTHPPRRLTRFVSLAVAAGALALAGPVAGASALDLPSLSSALPAPALPATLPAALPVPLLPIGGSAIGGVQSGTAGCVGTNRPSFGGNNGSTSAQTCGAILSFSGPQIGQISATIGPTIIGSPASNVIVSSGSVTSAVQVP